MILVGPSGSGKSTALRMLAGLEDITEGVLNIGDAMGRAIVRDPKAFLMDEPLSNLDAKLRVQTPTAISRLHGRLGTTIVYVPHDQIEAVTLGDRIAVMRAGRIQQGVDAARVASSAEGVPVVARLGSASGVKRGQEARLWVDTPQLHLFDQETGRSLLTSESSRLETPSPRQPPVAG
jgi:ABC-type sugar transport system ATPase subunit